MTKQFMPRIAAIALTTFGLGCVLARAQAAAQPLPQFIQQQQTVHIPISAIRRVGLLPLQNLSASDLTLDIDGVPRPFQLSRPWDHTLDPKTGQPKDRPNLLIVVPLGAPIDRKSSIEQAILDLSAEPDRGWNISILDDGGEQTAYTRNLKTAIEQLKNIATEEPADIDIGDWRVAATLAIASMRDLHGRRVVMALGDIYHVILLDQGQVAYEDFEVNDIATAARDAGAVIYAADSFPELGRLRALSPYYEVLGTGPWLLTTQDGHVAGWISNSVSDTLKEIRQDRMSAYDIDLRLDPKQMDGELHAVSVTGRRPQTILNTPPYYIAPNLARLRLLAEVSPELRHALDHKPSAAPSPLQLATQLAYFPHADGKTGTQLATTGFFWSGAAKAPSQLRTALQLEQTSSGYITETAIRSLDWSSAEPVWTTGLQVSPGAYMLRVAAEDATGKIVAAADTPFNVDPTTDETVLISSLVLGKTCLFAPPPTAPAADANKVDYLRAGNCDLQPDPTHYYSPQDIVWTLARITPTGKLARRPSKSWKASFVIVDVKGSKLAEQPVRWLTAEDGSFVATAAFPLDDPKLKLFNQEYAVIFKLKGPGIESDYGEDASFMVYGASPAPAENMR